MPFDTVPNADGGLSVVDVPVPNPTLSNRVKAIFALSRILFLWGVVGLLIGGGNGSAASIELSDYSRDFVVQNWTVDDGLPQNSVLGITQTPDGYLWFATYNGLVRFDGVKFTVFDTSNTPEMGSSAVYAMHLATGAYASSWKAAIFW